MSTDGYIPAACILCGEGFGYGPESCHRCKRQRKAVKDAFSPGDRSCNCSLPDPGMFVPVENLCRTCGHIYHRYGWTLDELRKALWPTR
jgi:hypothetical protein